MACAFQADISDLDNVDVTLDGVESIVRLPTGVLTLANLGNMCSSGFTFGSYILGVAGYPRNPYGDNLKKLQMCSLANQNQVSGPQGTLCGFVYFGLSILCNNRNPTSEPCPSGFSQYIWKKYGDYPTTLWACQKDIINVDDPPGTLCAFHSTVSQHGGIDTKCNGYDPGQGKYPPDYTLYQARIPSELGAPTISLCARS